MNENNINNFVIDNDYILKIHNNSVYNNTILEYYKKYIQEGNNIAESRIHALNRCNKFWSIDVYDYNGIKDYISTNLCKDKFCNNCKKVKQASRMSRYIPELEPYKDNLYHITFTIPNVVGDELKDTLVRMKKAFRNVIRLMDSRQKVKGIDFKQYGYKGAVRSLEITFHEDMYHPHYHCAFVLEHLNMNKHIKNVYSTDYLGNREDRLFSDFEILIQKIWYLCYNNITVTKENIDSLEQGYSCICDKFYENDYMELFKYMTKETDEVNNILTYNNFKALYTSTYRLKQIQGYGCLYRISDEDLEDEIDKVYSSIVSFLSENETPRCSTETPYDLLNDNYKIISRKKIYKYLKSLY